MAKREDPKVKARALVKSARVKAAKIVADARAKAKALVAAARAKANALVAKARARARAQVKAKAERAKSRKESSSRKKPAHKPTYQLQAFERLNQDRRGKRAGTMTAKEIKQTNPRIPVEAVLSAINAFYANPEFRGPVMIAAIRSQRPLLGKHEIDYQITELARVGLIRLIRASDLKTDVAFEVRSKGYPWAAPEYAALEKVG